MDKKEFKILLKEYKSGQKKHSFKIGKYLHEHKKYKKAIKYFEEYMELKDYSNYFETLRLIGDYYYNGLGVKKDISKAMKNYKDVMFIYKDIQKLVLNYYYEIGEYSSIIYEVEKFADKDDKALKFCYEYYKDKSNASKTILYAEKILDKNEDEEIAKLLIDYYERYYLNEKQEKFVQLVKKYSKIPLIGYKLGRMYLYGICIEQDYSAAYKQFSSASRKGIEDARAHIAYFYYKGIEVEQNTKKAITTLKNLKSSLSAYYLYRIYTETKEKISFFEQSDFEKAIEDIPEAAAYVARLKRENKYPGKTYYTINKYISHAVREKIPEGYLESAIEYYNKKEYEKAYEEFKYASDRGVTEANIYLSKLLKEGLGCKKDESKADELLDSATDPNSIYMKALDLFKVHKDKEAIELLVSIMNEHDDAKFEIGKRHLYGKKTEKHEEYGFKLISELRGKHYKYTYEYIKCIYYGNGTTKNYTTFSKMISSYISMDRYNKEKLDKELDYIVGEAYYKGNGLKQSDVESLKFLAYAKAAKYKPAIELYEIVDKAIKEKEAIEAEKRRIAEEQRKKLEAERKALETAKTVIFNELFNKYKDYRISIPNIKSVYRGYGNLCFDHIVDTISKTSTIVVRGTMNYSMYISENDKNVISEEIYQYVKKYVDEFYKKYPDYPVKITLKNEFTIWYEY